MPGANHYSADICQRPARRINTIDSPRARVARIHFGDSFIQKNAELRLLRAEVPEHQEQRRFLTWDKLPACLFSSRGMPGCPEFLDDRLEAHLTLVQSKVFP